MISKQKISKYISELLFLHDCVIIPGFGGFVANINNAKLVNGNQFIPQTKHFVFNKNLTRNDGLLINYISEKENINYVDAKNELKKLVAEIYYELSENHSFVIEKIGAFSVGKEATLHFEQDFSYNYHINSFGLTRITFPELIEIHNSEIQNVTPKRIDKESINISIKKSFVRKTIIAIPVILALTILPFSTKISNQNSYNKASILNIKMDVATLKVEKEIAKKTSIQEAMRYEEIDTLNIQNEKVERINEEEIIPKKVIETKPEVATIEKGKYYLIGGSFNNAESAEIQKQIYEKQGYAPTVIDQGKNRFRVCLDILDSKNNAKNEILKLRKENKNLQVWLLEI
jgi:hypothetical protein